MAEPSAELKKKKSHLAAVVRIILHYSGDKTQWSFLGCKLHLSAPVVSVCLFMYAMCICVFICA